MKVKKCNILLFYSDFREQARFWRIFLVPLTSCLLDGYTPQPLHLNYYNY